MYRSENIEKGIVKILLFYVSLKIGTFLRLIFIWKRINKKTSTSTDKHSSNCSCALV